MPNANPLLTIAIPTYNRERNLQELLSKLLPQIGNDERVEILISDNASQDGTPCVAARSAELNSSVRYIRNDANLGADRNILQCYTEACGKYVWIFSDDDLIEPGAVTRILNVISIRQFDIICVRGYAFEGEYNGPRSFIPKRDLEFENSEDLARHVHVFLTFISSVIVNKELNSLKPHRAFESLVGTNLVQLGPFYTALNRHKRSLLIRDPIIAARGNSNVGYALYQVFGPTFTRITREWIDREVTQRVILRGTIQKFFPFWLLMSRQAKASRIKENPHAVLRNCFGSELRYWIFDYPIYVLPLPLAKSWMLGVRVINKIDNILLEFGQANAS